MLRPPLRQRCPASLAQTLQPAGAAGGAEDDTGPDLGGEVAPGQAANDGCAGQPCRGAVCHRAHGCGTGTREELTRWMDA